MSILRKLLGRPDERSLNQLITDLTAKKNRSSDVRELYRRLPTLSLFTKLLHSSFDIQRGARHVVGEGEQLQIQTARLHGGQHLVVFYVDKSDARLSPAFGGFNAREAFEMVLKITNVDGMMLCNPANDWFALLKPEIQRLLTNELA
jgi:hypothetical protein